ncbi:unnamed protein product, partial [Medioppia subpectinata]
MPEVVVKPHDIEINENESGVLVCTAYGSPPPKVSWNITGLQSNVTLKQTLQTVVIEKSSHNSNKSHSDHKKAVNARNITKISQTLYLNEAHGADNGYVVCIAENIVGKSKDSSFLRILCTYLSLEHYLRVPPVTKTWYFNNQPLNMSETIKDLDIATVIKNDYETEGCLQIERATHVNDGLYTLIAVNSLGQFNRSVEAQFHKDVKPIQRPTPRLPKLPPHPSIPSGETITRQPEDSSPTQKSTWNI